MVWKRPYDETVREEAIMLTQTIVVIEENQEVRRTFTSILSRIDKYCVKQFSTGEEILESLPTLIMAPPALILIGNTLPKISSFELYDRLRSIPALFPVPILFLTAYERLAADKNRMTKQTSIFKKPFVMESFLKLVEKALQANVTGKQL